MTTLLSGIVGSTAYGLARAGSDVDRLGVFAAPTVAFHGLDEPQDSAVTTDPDVTMHEARKFAKLALAGNPTVSELLWLPGDLYEARTPLGDELIGIRASFLSAKRIRDAYLGYATQQFRRLENRGDGSFSADTRKRTSKHARHLYRLCAQGYELYATGALRIRLEEPWRFHQFGDQVAAGHLDVAREMLADFEAKFDETASVLPEEPDQRTVEDWLLRVRKAYL
jgi:predicted nucleotidyltransferase